jgi:ABC-2 type transport system permease protein
MAQPPAPVVDRDTPDRGLSAMAITRIPAALVRTSLMTALQYRSDFLFEAFTGLLRTVAAVAPLFLVYSHRDSVQGWTQDESLLVMSFFLLFGAFNGGVMEPNLGAVVEMIRQGTLDLLLLKPADSQLLVSLRKVDPAHLWDLLAALVVGVYATSRIATPGALDVLVAAALLGCGLAAMYGLWMLAICTSFFFVRVDNLRYLLGAIADAGRWPLPMFGREVRWALTVLVPVGVVTSFPAEALRGTWGPGLIATALLVAIGFVTVSRLAWNRSLAYYTSASS